ncbi:MAG TPA: hypothetical protein H9761_06470 [Candidatus Eisenbergiella merdavium]|uniref:Uncharacterized protein n=1 Tax=Candidatus Eisenbergiella merdavium TaxID=2838551 RepID=A0A9D2ND88_9FIRM|nr:hypothetical protein [Candidatus Eisenbergiella merdavium]
MDKTLTIKNKNSGTAREASTVMDASAQLLPEAGRDTLFAIGFWGEKNS